MPQLLGSSAGEEKLDLVTSLVIGSSQVLIGSLAAKAALDGVDDTVTSVSASESFCQI